MASAQGEEMKVHDQPANAFSESVKKCGEKERELQKYEEIGMQEGGKIEIDKCEEAEMEKKEKKEKPDKDESTDEKKEKKEKPDKHESTDEKKKEKKETSDATETKHKKEKKKEKKEPKYSVERLKQKLEKIESKMQKLLLKKEECLKLLKEAEQRILHEGTPVHLGGPTTTGNLNEKGSEKLGDEIASLSISDTKVEAVAMSMEGCNEGIPIESITYTKVDETSVLAADK